MKGCRTDKEGALRRGRLPGRVEDLREDGQADSRAHDAEAEARHSLHEARHCHRHAAAAPRAPLHRRPGNAPRLRCNLVISGKGPAEA